MNTLGRSTIVANSTACVTVASVLCASDGSTSMDTLPSTPSEASLRAQHIAGRPDVVGDRRADCGVDVGIAGRQQGDLAIVGAAVCKCALKGGRVSGHADNASRVDQLLQLAGLQRLRDKSSTQTDTPGRRQGSHTRVLSHPATAP